MPWRLALFILNESPTLVLSPTFLFQSVSCEFFQLPPSCRTLHRCSSDYLLYIILDHQWRIITDRQSAPEESFKEIPTDVKGENIPEMASRLLGWDTTLQWEHEASVNHVNFPGLLPLSESSQSKIGHRHPFSVPDLSINISQSIVTHETE